MTQPSSLWRHADFLKLWCGQTISLLGSEITVIALSLTAIRDLNATPAQMGLLSAATYAPFMLFGILAGVWVDRLRRKPILIATDVGRGVLLLFIPVAAVAGWLRIQQLYVLAFLLSTLTAFFEVAYAAYLPSLVSRQQLVDGNSRMEFSQSTVRVLAPGAGGLLVQLFTAPFAVIVDALSFLASAVSLMLIGQQEPVVPSGNGQRNFVAELRQGVGVTFSNPFLLIIAGTTAVNALFLTAQGAIFIMYMSRDLSVQPAALGVIFSVGSLGGVFGSFIAKRLSARLGLGRTIILSHLLYAGAILLLPIARGPMYVVVPTLILSNTLFGFGMVVKGITVLSFRQSLTPDHLQGRVTAVVRFMASCALPIGSVLGGALGDSLGLRPTLVVCGLGSLGVALWLLQSPVRQVREPPGPKPGLAAQVN